MGAGFASSEGRDEMLVDGPLQGMEQILNIRYGSGDVGPVTGETMSEGSIGCMRLSRGYCRQLLDLFDPLPNFARDIFFGEGVGSECSA